MDSAHSWAAVDWLRQLGVEILADESARTASPYILPRNPHLDSRAGDEAILGPYGAPIRHVVDGRIRRGADNCAYTYYGRVAPSVEKVLDERSGYYNVLVLSGGTGMPSQKQLLATGLRAVLTVRKLSMLHSFEDVIILPVSIYLKVELDHPSLLPPKGRTRGSRSKAAPTAGQVPIAVVWSPPSVPPPPNSDGSPAAGAFNSTAGPLFSTLFLRRYECTYASYP